jgi:O-methyltransferase
MSSIKNFLNKLPYIRTLVHENNILKMSVGAEDKYYQIFEMFKPYTMIPKDFYVQNLLLANKFKDVKGVVVECGTWKGGMIGGIAKMLQQPDRKYYLFDSYEGLPDAIELDGKQAQAFATDPKMIEQYDNCKADIEFAREAMKISGAKNVEIIKGWFNDTLPHFPKNEGIAILRLDGDWYESTMECLDNLFDKVVDGGIIIFDDYYSWEGCSKAVHDFLSKKKSVIRIRQFQNTICYIEKNLTKYY